APASLSCCSSSGSVPPPLPHLSLHDALPISFLPPLRCSFSGSLLGSRLSRGLFAKIYEIFRQRICPIGDAARAEADNEIARLCEDRKSTRLNSSHVKISYAVFCLKKKKRWWE